MAGKGRQSCRLYYCGAHGIVFPVSGGHPELAVVDVGRDHLLVAPLAVLLSDELHQHVVDVGASREEEAAAGTQLVEEEELLFPPQLAVVSLGGLLLEHLPLLQLLLVREGDAVDPLEGLSVRLALPVGGGVLHGDIHTGDDLYHMRIIISNVGLAYATPITPHWKVLWS